MKIFCVNTMRIAMFLSAFCFSCWRIQADSIVTDTGTVTGSVQSVTANEVKFDDGKTVPVKTVRKIEFDSFAVAAKRSGIVLKEGSLLTGLIRGTGENLNFRSTDFGEMKIRIQSVAVIFMDLDLWTRFADKKLNAPCLVDKNETVYAGKIMWWDAKSAGVMTEDGLKKIPAEDIGFICYAPFIKASKIILRNGDIVNFQKEFAGNNVSFVFDDSKFAVPLKAVREINF